MTIAYLALGSNLRNPERQLRRAIQTIRVMPRVFLLKTAPLYSNPAWGRRAQPHFYNTVIKIATSFSPKQLLQLCQKIERMQGRVRKIRWGARTLDIDVILYGNIHLKTPSLTIPHPRFHERDFVTIPLKRCMES